MKLERFFQYLKYEKRFSSHTLTAYEGDLKQFAEFLENTYELSDEMSINHFQIRSWIVDLLNLGISPRSINRKLSCLKTYFKFLRKQGMVEFNPMAKIISPKTSKRLPVFVNENNMSALFERANFGEGYSAVRDYLIMEVLYCTGMRRSELVGLRMEDVDFTKYQLKVLGKGSKERLIPIASHLVKLIEQYKTERKENFPNNPSRHLFLTNKGQPMYPSFVYKLVRKYLSLVTTLEQRSPHVLRHTFATHLSNSGADLNAIKELLGHSSLAATQVYTHNSIEKLRKIYQQAHPKAKSSQTS